MAILIAHRPLRNRVGATMLCAWQDSAPSPFSSAFREADPVDVVAVVRGRDGHGERGRARHPGAIATPDEMRGRVKRRGNDFYRRFK